MKTALLIGISEHEFWEMTLAEVSRLADAYNERKKMELRERAQMDYAQNAHLASLIGKMLGGKGEIPTIYQIYPSLFEEQLPDKQDEKSVANFLAFARRHNKEFNTCQIK